jgi:hypothetical protein
MLWWISGGVLVLLLVGLLIFRRWQNRVVVLPSPHPRRLGPEESAAGKEALERALKLILAARDQGDPRWQGFEPANYPHVTVRGDKQRSKIYWIYFSLRIWYVPAAGEVVTSFHVGVTPKGLEGHSSYSLDCNDYGALSEPRQPFSHSFWKETDGARETLNFVDQAIRQHADFGVYGNLTAGIEALAQAGCTVGVRENEDGYSVHVNPIDGHGHFHHFQVFKDGRVGESACGHMDPMPEEL